MTNAELDPTVTDATTVLDCGYSTFDSSTLSFGNWCGEALPSPVVQVQSDGSEVAILPLRGLYIGPGSRLQLLGSRPVIFAIYGDARIEGHIDADAWFEPGPGGRYCPVGTGGGGGPATESYMGGAGAGHATAGGAGTENPNVGLPYGTLDAVPLLGGCQGGSASNLGGQGGGAVQVSAAGTVAIDGSVTARGSNGREGYMSTGGGGGSGGSILIEGSVVLIAGTLNADGGSGGSSNVFYWNAAPGGVGGSATNEPGAGQLGAGGGGSAGVIRLNAQACNPAEGAISPVETTSCAVSCENGVRDADETDVDCGGSFCAPCPYAEACSASADCVTDSCEAGTCSWTCANAMIDGTETDIDCGGSSCCTCDHGQACSTYSDCSAGDCIDGRCDAAACPGGPLGAVDSIRIIEASIYLTYGDAGASFPACHYYSDDSYFILQNTDSSCRANVSGLHLVTADATVGDPVINGPDFTMNEPLPSYTLEPGEIVYVTSVLHPRYDGITLPDIGDFAWAMLCKAPCDATSAPAVVDFVAITSELPYPSPATFDTPLTPELSPEFIPWTRGTALPDHPCFNYRDTYKRRALDAVAPNFIASDWYVWEYFMYSDFGGPTTWF